ncbi:MAG TPA: hypothetical protein IAB94_00915 [Candidatus Coproplasma avicola]|uniref:Uncharacterized protein n=1 Tax=Candidatus Coproplasma avicola TaxID=2840744 RepID=A0A9D1J8N2_9FIRM|nr:hypothetical protein [Candidatus Coproplasma avicola]
MFGYIQPERPHMFVKDEMLYKALYCGMCKSIKQGSGQMARTALTYDMAFVSALVHNLKNVDVVVKKRRCALHPLKRRYMALPDDTSVLLGCINTALAYYKLLDDKSDGDKKGLFAFLYKSGYKKTVKKHPVAARIISDQLAAQSALENEGCAVIDAACEPTARMMEKLSEYILGDKSDSHTCGLFYDIGKWIYLADALDDYDKDVKKGRYNVLYNAFKSRTKAQAVEQNEEEINFIFNALFADMRMHLANVKFHFNHDLTDNIILLGIPAKTRSLVYGRCGQGKKEEQYEQTQS